MLKKIIYPTHNSNQEKHVTLLIISSGEKLRHYLALKKLSPLSTGITSKYYGEFDCLHSFRKKNRLAAHKRVCENKDFCNVTMPSEDTKNIRI